MGTEIMHLNWKTVKIELELDKEELKIIDIIMVCCEIELRSEVIKSIIINLPDVKLLIQRYQNEIKELNKENSKLKKKTKSPNVANKKPVEMSVSSK